MKLRYKIGGWPKEMKPRADTVAASCRSDARHPSLPFLSFFFFHILLILRPKWFEFRIDIMGETENRV
jgi:hypothetical protein